jgi:hypothetical protein
MIPHYSSLLRIKVQKKPPVVLRAVPKRTPQAIACGGIASEVRYLQRQAEHDMYG